MCMRYLERDAVAIGAASIRCAVEISGAVNCQAAIGLPANGVTGEAVQKFVGPGSRLRQPEDGALVSRAAASGNAIKISRRIGNQRALRTIALAAVKAVQDRQRPAAGGRARSEEHTSELQSLRHL